MALSTATATELTAEQVASVLTQPLERASVFLAAQPRIFDTAGPLRIPKAPASTEDALTWTGENEQIAEANAEFDELKLLPSTMKSVKVITRYSNELARQSVVNLEQAIRDRLVRDVAAKIDGQLFSDSGDGVETPRGLFAYADVQDVAVAGELTIDHFLEAQGMALAANVDVDRLRFVMRPQDYTSLRGQTDNDGRYMLQPDATQGAVAAILGTPVMLSQRVPAGRAAAVDFSQIAVARDLAQSVKVLTERYADYDQQALRVVSRYDAGPLNSEAVITLSGIITA
jgi:HK97 family phage major capsid protein